MIFFLVIALVYVFVWISGYNTTETSIETYYRNESTDAFIQTVPGYANYSLVVLLLALCTFEIFRRIHIRPNKVINFLGKATFMVYLVHDNQFFYDLWNFRGWIGTLARSPISFALNLLKWGGYTFAAGVAAYVLYLFVKFMLKKGRKLALSPSDTD